MVRVGFDVVSEPDIVLTLQPGPIDYPLVKRPNSGFVIQTTNQVLHRRADRHRGSVSVPFRRPELILEAQRRQLGAALVHDQGQHRALAGLMVGHKVKSLRQQVPQHQGQMARKKERKN